MSNLCMLRHRKVLQDSAGSYDTILQVFHAKMLQQLLTGGGFRKYPVVKLEGKELAAEIPLKHQAFATLEKNLFRSEVVQQFVHIVKRAFRSKKFAGRYIEKGNSTGSLSEMDGSQEVVLLIVQYIIIDGNTRHLNGFTFSVCTFCQCDSQNFRSNNGICRICFIKVAATKQHHCIRMLRLQIQKLFHHRGKDDFFFVHGSLLFFFI